MKALTMSTASSNISLRLRMTLLVAMVIALPMLGSCGIPTDDQPRNIDPSQQSNLNKP
jgi:hypothetical protein